MQLGDTLRLGRRLVKSVVGRDVPHRPEISIPAEEFGTRDHSFVVYTRHLHSGSIVYSFGVGDDASFDLELIASTGVTVHAFDPTPRSLQWAGEQDFPPSFQFHPLGIADYDGKASFNAPVNPGYVSYTLAPAEGDRRQAVDADVRRLGSIMDDLRHDHVDLLKLDIEGAEFAVLEDIMAANLDVRQVLVEFHHRFASIPLSETVDAVARLGVCGYKLFYVSPKGEEYSFIRADHIDPVHS